MTKILVELLGMDVHTDEKVYPLDIHFLDIHFLSRGRPSSDVSDPGYRARVGSTP
ncbi:hypothetical protein BD309DRAFT_952606 [Dichomitus squalens]|nr:hypothetical protein BD309DRAFT_952606 [Dichomitus squalens]